MTMKAAKKLSACDAVRLKLLRHEARKQALLREGDFVELGVYQGGSALVLADCLRFAQSRMKLHLLDSWQGLPAPTEQDSGTFIRGGEFAGERFKDPSAQKVLDVLTSRHLNHYCKIHEGWFADTLPKIDGPLSLVHLDCDLFAPAFECLEYVLPRMSEHGIVILDDYGDDAKRRFPGIKKAVDACIAGTDWTVVPLGGEHDASAKLVRRNGSV